MWYTFERREVRAAPDREGFGAFLFLGVTENPRADGLRRPDVLPLPKPLAFESSQPISGDKSSENGKTEGLSPKVYIPAEDLKPIYDFAVDCKECQAKLSAAQAGLQDERTKTKALSKERDDALRAAHGGSVLRRVGRAAKWFVIGAAAGAVAVKLAH
jgi:hypothetical protein